MENKIMKKIKKIPLVCLLFLIGYSSVAKAQSNINIVAKNAHAPGFYRIKLGAYEITVISDGTMLMPVDRLLQGAQPGEIAAAYKRNYESLPIETSMNCFLINTGSKLILVDVGGGDVYRPAGLGQLISNLNAAGYKPEQIDAILVTHSHVDHVGGLFINGKIAFPNAQIYMHQADYDLLFSPSGEPYRKYFTNEVSVMTPYRDAGKIKTFANQSVLFPGITAIPAPGHTPGHTFYQVVSGDNKLLLWGDIVHAAEAQFPDPALTFQFDLDANSAKAQRLKIFADAAKQGYLIGGAHIAFPGLGHVAADNGKYSWIPVSYSNGNTKIFFK
jgi:glyoxylase-like metal-dependent hydrolase (beta-lactamase superfamily II)